MTPCAHISPKVEYVRCPPARPERSRREGDSFDGSMQKHANNKTGGRVGEMNFGKVGDIPSQCFEVDMAPKLLLGAASYC